MGKKRSGRKKSGRKSRSTTRHKRSNRSQRKTGGRFAELAIVAMLLSAAYFAIFGGEYTVFQLKRMEATELRRAAELAQAEAEIDSLQHVASGLKNDPAEIERVARERYGMIKDGEILYRFLEAPSGEEAADSTTKPRP